MPFVSGGAARALLAEDDPPPVQIVNRFGASPFLFVGDHAGNAIPKALGALGLGRDDCVRHIAWDIGTRALGERLSALLDATFIHQRYSRLVIDCNRDPESADAMPAVSDGTRVPANEKLENEDRAARIDAIHEPYQHAIAEEIDTRGTTVLVSLHSFTPRLAGGSDRPWQIGVLHDGYDDGFACALLATLRRNPELVVGDNEPYRMDATDHTVPRQAFAAGLSYAEIEIRQDLLDHEEAIERWARLLTEALTGALAS